MTVRAEEVVLEVPGGRSITTLINATPIHSEEGRVESVIVTLQDMAPLEQLERSLLQCLEVLSRDITHPGLSRAGWTSRGDLGLR